MARSTVHSVASSSPGAGPSTPATVSASTSRALLPMHSSIPTHLSTELSFLSTMILRARDQHRTQLFLRRMYEVLRVGKCLLGLVRKGSPGGSGGAAVARALTDLGPDELRHKAEKIVRRMIKVLFNAHRFTSQIIELHHFLPLQTTILSIYARLFGLAMNVANALSMDPEGLIMDGGQREVKSQRKESEADRSRLPREPSTEVTVTMAGANGARQSDSDVNSGDMDLELGVSITRGVNMELGEKVERPSTAVPSARSSSTPIHPTSNFGPESSFEPKAENNLVSKGPDEVTSLSLANQSKKEGKALKKWDQPYSDITDIPSYSRERSSSSPESEDVSQLKRGKVPTTAKLKHKRALDTEAESSFVNTVNPREPPEGAESRQSSLDVAGVRPSQGQCQEGYEVNDESTISDREVGIGNNVRERKIKKKKKDIAKISKEEKDDEAGNPGTLPFDNSKNVSAKIQMGQEPRTNIKSQQKPKLKKKKKDTMDDIFGF